MRTWLGVVCFYQGLGRPVDEYGWTRLFDPVTWIDWRRVLDPPRVGTVHRSRRTGYYRVDQVTPLGYFSVAEATEADRLVGIISVAIALPGLSGPEAAVEYLTAALSQRHGKEKP